MAHQADKIPWLLVSKHLTHRYQDKRYLDDPQLEDEIDELLPKLYPDENKDAQLGITDLFPNFDPDQANDLGDFVSAFEYAIAEDGAKAMKTFETGPGVADLERIILDNRIVRKISPALHFVSSMEYTEACYPVPVCLRLFDDQGAGRPCYCQSFLDRTRAHYCHPTEEHTGSPTPEDCKSKAFLHPMELSRCRGGLVDWDMECNRDSWRHDNKAWRRRLQMVKALLLYGEIEPLLKISAFGSITIDWPNPRHHIRAEGGYYHNADNDSDL